MVVVVATVMGKMTLCTMMVAEMVVFVAVVVAALAVAVVIAATTVQWTGLAQAPRMSQHDCQNLAIASQLGATRPIVAPSPTSSFSRAHAQWWLFPKCHLGTLPVLK